MMDPKLPARKSIVTSVEVCPSNSKVGEEPTESWDVWISTRSGLMPTNYAALRFRNKEDAERFAALHPTGSEIPDTLDGSLHGDRQSISKEIDNPDSGRFCRGDRHSPIAWQVLIDAGISDQHGLTLSDEVSKFLGVTRLNALKKRFGENWQAAAEYEYCLLKLPHWSPAHLAAAYNYHYFITHDDFSAGYLLRDLEILVHGVEAVAVNAIEMRRKAGEAGSKQSAGARVKRMAALMDAMEAVVRRNPDVAKLGPDTVARLAIEKCDEAAPALWGQGKKQLAQYLGEIRRGEAGKEMQDRYFALFPKKPPKR